MAPAPSILSTMVSSLSLYLLTMATPMHTDPTVSATVTDTVTYDCQGLTREAENCEEHAKEEAEKAEKEHAREAEYCEEHANEEAEKAEEDAREADYCEEQAEEDAKAEEAAAEDTDVRKVDKESFARKGTKKKVTSEKAIPRASPLDCVNHHPCCTTPRPKCVPNPYSASSSPWTCSSNHRTPPYPTPSLSEGRRM